MIRFFTMPLRRPVAALALLMAAPALSVPAQASVYVDSKLVDLTPAERVTVVNPQPVQMLVEFQTAGVPNAKATKYVKKLVLDELTAGKMVGAVSDTPLPSGARLEITMNDIPDKNAAGKGFAAGLTFGLAGVVAGDTYDVTINYIPAAGTAGISKIEHYRIVFKFGNKTLPPDLVKAKGMVEAVQSMVHLTLSHGLNEIAADPAFAAISPVTLPAAPPAPAPAATPATAATPAPVS